MLLQRPIFFLAALFFTFFADANESLLSVRDVLNAFPNAAEMKPSLSVLHMADQQAYQKIGTRWYELRFVRYADPFNKVSNKTLKKVAQDYQFELEKLKLRTVEEGPIPIYTFTQPRELKEMGVSIVLSVRPLQAGEHPENEVKALEK